MTIDSVLVGKLERSVDADRRLDSEVVAFAVGPAGCVIDPVEGLDGWDIQLAPDASGEAACWREAADIPALTLNLDAVVELLSETRRVDASAIFMRAMRAFVTSHSSAVVEDLASRAARSILAELVKTIASERKVPIAYAA